MNQKLMKNAPVNASRPTPVKVVYDGSNRDRLALSAWLVMFRELREFRELIQRLVFRNFTAQFRQSFFGYLWIALPPIATAFMFAVLRKANIINIELDDSDMPYALYSLVGITVWGAFTQYVSAAMHSMSGSGGLVAKVYFPREVLVFSSIGQAIVNTIIRTAVVILMFVLFRYGAHWQVIFIPLVLLPMLALSMGLGMLFAPVNTMMRDMSRLVEFVFTFGVFMTPAIYKTPGLGTGDPFKNIVFWVHALNPVTYFIHAVRDLIQTGSVVLSPGLTASIILGFLIFAIGWRFFHACEPLLAERL